MREHRVPMLGGALRRRSDPARSSDPRVRDLVAALATLEVAPAPRADFRAELRAQLIAVTPRLVAEGNAETKTPSAGSAKPAAAPERKRVHLVHLRKPLFALAGAMAAFIVLLGGAVLLSRNALPGDALYGVKRASENTEYNLTGGSVDKGKLKLEFAARRIDEVGDLIHLPSAMAAGNGPVADSGQLNADTSKLVRQTLGSADSDVRTASQLLGTAAVHKKSTAPLNNIASWSPSQIKSMTAIVARIPAGDAALHNRANQTLALLKAAQARAATLATDLNCSCLGTSGTDALGPVPCVTGCSSPTPASRNPAKTTTPGTTKSTQPRVTAPGTGGATTTTTPARGPAQTSTTPAPGVTPTPGSTTTKPGVPIVTKPPAPGLPKPSGLPTLTLPNGQATSTPILPIGVDSCGLHASLGPIGIGIGGC